MKRWLPVEFTTVNTQAQERLGISIPKIEGDMSLLLKEIVKISYEEGYKASKLDIGDELKEVLDSYEESIRVREGNGPEDPFASVAASLLSMNQRIRVEKALDKVNPSSFE